MEVLEYSFDLVRLGTLAVRVTDDGGTFDLSIAADRELVHRAVASAVDHRGATPKRIASLEVLATVLEDELNDRTAGLGAYTVTYDPTTPAWYTIAYDNGSVQLDFRDATVGAGGPRLARILGLSSAAELDAASHASTARPYFVILPGAMARTGVKADRYDAGVSADAPADGGLYGQISRFRSAVNKDWIQAGEDDGSIGEVAFDEPGTPVHAYRATEQIPWSYQHAWDHAISYKCVIRVDDDHPSSLPEVVEMRADGLVFSPTFTGADDYPMYSLEYRTRLLARVLPVEEPPADPGTLRDTLPVLASWTPTSSPSSVGGQADPFGGTAAELSTDDSAIATEYYTGVFAGWPLVTATPYEVRIAVKKDAITSRFPELHVVRGSAYAFIQLNTQTGATTIRSQSGLAALSATAATHPSNSGWWRVTIALTVSTAGSLTVRFIPAAGTSFGAGSSAATGSVTWHPPGGLYEMP